MELPLSWIKSNTQIISFHTIPLSQGSDWIALAEVPRLIDGSTVIQRVVGNIQKKIIIRGCNYDIKTELGQNGFECIPTGREAVLDFNGSHFQKKSLKELIRRGKRHGEVIELKYNDRNIELLENFRNYVKHHKEPQLKHLFLDKFIPSTRLFAFIGKSGKWYGAVLISENSKTKYQTELLLRRVKAPVGIIEALIFEIFNKLKKSGFKSFSLGEVPFILNLNEYSFFSKTYIINKVGHFIKFAYNYEGLFKFKNKFAPRWEVVYLCSKPKLTYLQIYHLVKNSNLLKLSLYKMH